MKKVLVLLLIAMVIRLVLSKPKKIVTGRALHKLKWFETRVNCAEAIAKCPAPPRPMIKPVSFGQSCSGQKGAIDPNTGSCYVAYQASVDWVDAWRACRAKNVGGKKGVLAQPKSRAELDVLGRYVGGIRAFKHMKSLETWLFVGLRNVQTNVWDEFYYPAVADTYGVDVKQDHHILKDSNLWLPNEPNNFKKEEFCGTVYAKNRKHYGLNDFRCFKAKSVVGYVCQF